MHRPCDISRRGPAPRLRRAAPWLILGAIVPGCLVDEDDKCGPNQIIYHDGKQDERCICMEGFSATAAGCVPCGANEVADPALGCACADGFVRESASAPCTMLAAGVTPPTGLDKPCTSNADCAGLEASFCDTFVSHTCLVQGCTTSPDNCFTGKECCDFTTMVPEWGTLCIAAGACQQ
jgi:hypothetical protein